eukprot:scaffold23171_cov18-Tisochrysis_lutea.AAC.2
MGRKLNGYLGSEHACVHACIAVVHGMTHGPIGEPLLTNSGFTQVAALSRLLGISELTHANERVRIAGRHSAQASTHRQMRVAGDLHEERGSHLRIDPNQRGTA